MTDTKQPYKHINYNSVVAGVKNKFLMRGSTDMLILLRCVYLGTDSVDTYAHAAFARDKVRERM
jgi:hypothetical protein